MATINIQITAISGFDSFGRFLRHTNNFALSRVQILLSFSSDQKIGGVGFVLMRPRNNQRQQNKTKQNQPTNQLTS